MRNKCNECGSDMIDQSKGPYIHFVCPKCGNAIATYDYSKEDPIKKDESIYVVKSANNIASTDILKTLSKVSGNNYLECKRIIETNGVICSGKAVEIIESLKLLKLNGIQVEISPEFKYGF